MISLGPAQDALNNLPTPSPDAAYLKQASSLASSGSMFQNPLDDSFGHIAELNFNGHADDLKNIPGAEGLAAQLSGASDHADAVKSVSGQMFASTMPTKAPIPAALVANSNLHPDDLTKVQDFNIPSVTQIMSTASAEQSMHAQLGTAGSNPCLPVQNAMEGTMKSAQSMTAATKALSNNGTSAALTSAVNAVKAASAAVNAGVIGAEAALSAALSGASSVINTAVNAVSGALSDMGNSLLGSMKTVRDSTEKTLNVATAGMIKNHVQNNPCMKEVLSPGGNVWVFNTAIVIKNAGDDLTASAAYLANDDLVSISTTLSSLGYETFEKSTDATKLSDTSTERNVSLTYTVDMDKWEKAVGASDNTISLIMVNIKNPVTGLDAWVKVQTIFDKLNTDNAAATSAASTSTSMAVVVQPVWSVTKKKGLLSPAMQTMTEPAPKTDSDPIPSSVPVVVQTQSQAAAQATKAAKAAAPPASVDTPIVIQAADPVPATTEQTFTKSLYMRRERTKTDALWITITKCSVEHLSGDGKIAYTLTNDGASVLGIMDYNLSASSISALIAEIKRKNVTTPLYFQCDTINFYTADGTLKIVQCVYLYIQYVDSTNQVSITAKQKAPGGGTMEMLWDTILFEDPA